MSDTRNDPNLTLKRVESLKRGRLSSDSTRLYLIRHGELLKARPNTYHGQMDIEVTPNGVAQLERVADRLAEIPLRAVYASTLRRSVQGAEQVAKRHGLSVVQRSAFREKHFGVWEGLTYDEVAERFPDDWARWLADPPTVKPPGGEAYHEMQARVLPALAEIVAAHPASEIALVAHGGVNRAILCHAMGLDLRYVFRIEQDHGALNIIEFFSEEPNPEPLAASGREYRPAVAQPARRGMTVVTLLNG
ncbi:MAG: histidine phosphatase family protein [Nitrospirae bacterium]|nr:histidine phosphatase family protein [Nitrospirota bacterium]